MFQRLIAYLLFVSACTSEFYDGRSGGQVPEGRRWISATSWRRRWNCQAKENDVDHCGTNHVCCVHRWNVAILHWRLSRNQSVMTIIFENRFNLKKSRGIYGIWWYFLFVTVDLSQFWWCLCCSSHPSLCFTFGESTLGHKLYNIKN